MSVTFLQPQRFFPLYRAITLRTWSLEIHFQRPSALLLGKRDKYLKSMSTTHRLWLASAFEASLCSSSFELPLSS